MKNNISVKNPLVTVITPAYNAKKHIAEAIKSVQNQTFDNWELIIIDDCSEDSTCEVVKELMAKDDRIRLIENYTNLGAAESRNRGLDAAKGTYIALLDADDIWYPNKLEKQIELAEDEEADIVYSSYDIIDGEGNKVKSTYVVPETVTYEGLLKENVIGCSAAVIRRETAKKYRFGSDFYLEDYVLWLDILKDNGKAVGCTQALAAWRYAMGSRSFNKIKVAKERWLVYRKCLRLSPVKSISLMCSYAKAALKKYM